MSPIFATLLICDWSKDLFLEKNPKSYVLNWPKSPGSLVFQSQFNEIAWRRFNFMMYKWAIKLWKLLYYLSFQPLSNYLPILAIIFIIWYQWAKNKLWSVKQKIYVVMCVKHFLLFPFWGNKLKYFTYFPWPKGFVEGGLKKY